MSVTASQKEPDFSLYPMAWLAFCFALGILAGNYFVFSNYIFLLACLAAVVFAVIVRQRKFAAGLICFAFISLGGLCQQIEKNSFAPNRLKNLYDTNEFVSGEPLEITGILQGKPELAVGGFFLELKTESAIYKNFDRVVSGNIRLFAPILSEQISGEYEQLNLHYGQRIRVACELNREERFLNPGVASQKTILDQKNFDASGVIKSPLLIENLGETKSFPFLNGFYESRQTLILEFKNIFPSRRRAF